jgi:hypothetical protein
MYLCLSRQCVKKYLILPQKAQLLKLDALCLYLCVITVPGIGVCSCTEGIAELSDGIASCTLGTEVGRVLRLYSRGNRSEGLQPQLVHCAPFLSIAPYFRMLYISYPKIRMAIVAYPKVRMTIIWYLGREESNVFLSEDKE